jgi:glycosyltransferase involved in cell wall biosynthesis
VNVHELEYALQTWDQILGGAISAMQRHATHYIAASGAVMKNLVARHGVAAERVTVVHEFIDTGEFSGAPFPCESNRSPLASIGVPPDAAVVGVVGSVEWRKGSDLLVALARLLPSTDARGRPIHLVWVGGGYPQDIAQLKFDVTTAGMDERVHIVGATDRSAAWYPAFSVLILPSREDPFPLVALEAAASGLPIVCFADAGGMPEFVEEDAGIVVPFLDLRLFAEAIARLLNDAPLRDEFGRNAASKVRRRHDVSVAVPQLLRVIENQIAAMDSNPDHR